jgi:hypothetical protein
MQVMSKLQFKDGDEILIADLGDHKMTYGGMATPFGIRIYTTLANAGATDLQMFLSGALYSFIIFACQYIVGYWESINEITIDKSLSLLVAVAAYLIVFRITPISSIHASEHQLIHAMEKDEILSRDSVKSQNRVHPRCGTNFMSLILMLSVFISLIEQMPVASWFKFVCIIPALIFTSWSSGTVGGFLQKHFTTKTARDKDIDQAIKIGIEHNTKFVEYVCTHEKQPSIVKGFIMYIKNSGLLHTMFAYVIIHLWLSAFFKIPGN